MLQMINGLKKCCAYIQEKKKEKGSYDIRQQVCKRLHETFPIKVLKVGIMDRVLQYS